MLSPRWPRSAGCPPGPGQGPSSPKARKVALTFLMPVCLWVLPTYWPYKSILSLIFSHISRWKRIFRKISLSRLSPKINSSKDTRDSLLSAGSSFFPPLLPEGALTGLPRSGWWWGPARRPHHGLRPHDPDGKLWARSQLPSKQPGPWSPPCQPHGHVKTPRSCIHRLNEISESGYEKRKMMIGTDFYKNT